MANFVEIELDASIPPAQFITIDGDIYPLKP